MAVGTTFTPGNRPQQGSGALQNGAEALRQISLRLPQTLGGSPIAPTSLLTPRVGGEPSFLGLQQAFQPNPTPAGAPQAPAAAPSAPPQIQMGQQGPGGLSQLLQRLFGPQNPFSPNTPPQASQAPQGPQVPPPDPNIVYGGPQGPVAAPSQPTQGIGPSSGFGGNLPRGAY